MKFCAVLEISEKSWQSRNLVLKVTVCLVNLVDVVISGNKNYIELDGDCSVSFSFLF